MKQKTYIIRKVAYHYSDEYLYVHTLGGIQHVYQSEAEAKQKLQALESKAFRVLDLGDIEQLSPCGYHNKFKQQREALDQYLREILGESLFHKSGHDDSLYMVLGTYLPNSLTDEQIMRIREISGIKFHELGEFEDEVIFYTIWITRTQKFYSADAGRYGESIYFFNSYEEAIEGAKELFSAFLWGKSLEGTLEELTEQPSILMSLISQSNALRYDPKKASLEIAHGLRGEELISLNALLRQPIFEIRTIPLSEAEKIPHDPFGIR
jgi:hypothetical protein